MKKANKCTAGVVKISLELAQFSPTLVGHFSGMISPACERHTGNHISGVLRTKQITGKRWYQIYVPSWRLSLKTKMRKAKLVTAIPKETIKWKDQRGSWANCVATNGDVNAPRPENTIWPIQIEWRKDCNHHMLLEEFPVLSLCCPSKLLWIHSLERPDCFFFVKYTGRSTRMWHTRKIMPTPLMKYAITKTGKGGADDWIAYAITCKSDPRTIVCIYATALAFTLNCPFRSAPPTFPKPSICVKYMLATAPPMYPCHKLVI